MKNVKIENYRERCQYGLVMGMCVGTKGQDTTKIRKGTVDTDEGLVCEGCFRVAFGGLTDE